ncbi:hypothetical protein SNARM312S_06071 [Streptomyces narbonensis]
MPPRSSFSSPFAGMSKDFTSSIFWFFVSSIVTSSEMGLVTEVSLSAVPLPLVMVRKPPAMSITGCGMNAPLTFSSGLSPSDEHPVSASEAARATAAVRAVVRRFTGSPP